jgi:uncharacterized glyoxalase superfamily protein PhnB
MKRSRKRVASKRASSARTRRRVPAPPPVARTAPDGSGLAPGMQVINTYLAVANVTASMEFLERAFGFSRGVVLADADRQVRYAEMRHGDAVVMLIRKGDGTTPTSGASALYTYVDDVDQALAQARKAGAGVEEAEDKPWGDRVAAVTDPDGYRWMLATFKKLAPFSQ